MAPSYSDWLQARQVHSAVIEDLQIIVRHVVPYFWPCPRIMGVKEEQNAVSGIDFVTLSA